MRRFTGILCVRKTLICRKAARLGLSGVQVSAKTIALHTIFKLMRVTGAQVHLSAAGVALVHASKAESLR